jgi:hypothetical protein
MVLSWYCVQPDRHDPAAPPQRRQTKTSTIKKREKE